MFLDFFYRLKEVGVPVSMQEWMMLMRALSMGQHSSSLMSFYNLARACLVKSEAYFDSFDRVFARVFHGIEGELSVSDELMKWLEDPKNFEATSGIWCASSSTMASALGSSSANPSSRRAISANSKW